MRATNGRCALLLLCAVAAACDHPDDAAAPRAVPPRSRPSVLIVTLDTVRGDALGCQGGPAWATPNLDALARRGVRFAAARAPAPVTLPAHATIFTGTWPFQHGVRDNGTFVLGAGAFTLAERLQAAGYATAAVPAAYVVDSAFGLAQGFDRYFDLVAHDLAIGDETEARRADEVAALATGWLAVQPADAPFLLWVHFFDAHFPYAPPPDLLAAHPIPEAPKPPSGGPPRPRDVRATEQRHLYQLEVANVDRALGPLLAALDRFGGAEQVVTLVVGDHGEGLGQHGEATHAMLAYDATLHVPFLLAHASLPQGRVVDDAVSTVDVTPTLLALLGLPAEGTAGADLAPLARGEPLASARPLYFENCSTWFTSGWSPLYGIVDGRWKTIVGRTARLFDVAFDPDELRDVAADHPDVVERAKERLQGFADATVEAARHALEPGESERLAALGYVVTQASARRGGLVPPGWQPKEALTPEQGLENGRRFARANQLWQQGQRDEGIEQLLQLVKEEPENSHYAEIAAALLVQIGRAGDALPLAQKAVELAENVGNRSTLVTCLLALGRRDEAFAEAQQTVARFPTLLPARLTLAQLLIERGRGADAIPHLETFLQQFAGDPAVAAQARALLAKARGS